MIKMGGRQVIVFYVHIKPSIRPHKIFDWATCGLRLGHSLTSTVVVYEMAFLNIQTVFLF